MVQTHEEVRKIYGEQIEAVARTAEAQAVGAAYVVYLILDRTRPDPHGRFSGIPLYVGQTGRIYGRTKDHLIDALVYRGDQGSLKEALASLIEAGNPPFVQVVQFCDSRISGCFAETRWAQKLLVMGYDLKNRAPLQANIMTSKQRINFERRALMAGDLQGIAWPPVAIGG